MTQAELDAIRARCEAATPGPWYGEENCGVYTDAENNKPVFETGCGCCTSSTLTPANAAFIAHSRDDIPYLLSEVDRLQAELERERRRAEAAVHDLAICRECDICKIDEESCPWLDGSIYAMTECTRDICITSLNKEASHDET